MLEFKRLMQQQSTEIDVQLDSIRKRQGEGDREILKPIIDTIIPFGH